MLDLLMLIMVAAAFIGAFGYVWACQGMTGRRSPASDRLP
jgi:nitrate reductase NapE component